MKKIAFVLAVLLLAAPAWAATISAVQVPDTNQVEIRYDFSEENLPRAFGLDITVTDGNIVSCTAAHIGECDADNRGYGIFPGTINIAADGKVNDWGSPAAPAGAVGTPDSDPNNWGIGTAGITIEMGSLYTDANAPPSSGVLCTIVVTENCTVNIAGNAARCEMGSEALGVVMENPDEVVIPTYVPCDVTLEPAVCVGDFDGNGFVNKTDIIKIVNCLIDNASPPFWSIPDTSPAYSAAADIDGNGFVNKTDIIKLVNYLVDNASPPFWSVPCP